MTAKQMFEKLGFEKVKENSSCITYETKNDRIYFGKETRIYIAQHYDTGAIVDIKLHKAITKQMEELKWL